MTDKEFQEKLNAMTSDDDRAADQLDVTVRIGDIMALVQLIGAFSKEAEERSLPISMIPTLVLADRALTRLDAKKNEVLRSYFEKTDPVKTPPPEKDPESDEIDQILSKLSTPVRLARKSVEQNQKFFNGEIKLNFMDAHKTAFTANVLLHHFDELGKILSPSEKLAVLMCKEDAEKLYDRLKKEVEVFANSEPDNAEAVKS